MSRLRTGYAASSRAHCPNYLQTPATSRSPTLPGATQNHGSSYQSICPCSIGSCDNLLVHSVVICPFLAGRPLPHNTFLPGRNWRWYVHSLKWHCLGRHEQIVREFPLLDYPTFCTKATDHRQCPTCARGQLEFELCCEAWREKAHEVVDFWTRQE